MNQPLQLDEKQELIVEAALKRFVHYGPAKTTMNEIADDLRLSKALIYYYFPDKASLLKAVLEKILNNYFLEIECEINHSKSVENALMSIVEVRQEFFIKYFLNLGLNRIALENNKDALDEIAKATNQREKKIVADLFHKANESGELRIADVNKTADLYIDLMRGLRLRYVAPGTCSSMLCEQSMEELYGQIKLMTEIFVKAHKNTN